MSNVQAPDQSSSSTSGPSSASGMVITDVTDEPDTLSGLGLYSHDKHPELSYSVVDAVNTGGIGTMPNVYMAQTPQQDNTKYNVQSATANQQLHDTMPTNTYPESVVLADSWSLIFMYSYVIYLFRLGFELL